MAVSWGFSVGNVRARETRLLTRQDAVHMASFASEKQLLSFLQDKGFENSREGLDGMLTAETAEIWKYAESVAADFTAFYPLLYENDYHNLKAVLKGVLSGREYKRLLLSPSVVPIGDIERAVKEKKFHLLPDDMAPAAARAYDILAHTSDAQLSDGILDQCRMKASCDAAGSSGLMAEYIGEKVFYENVKVALRAARAHKDAAFLEDTLYLPGISGNGLMAAALTGEKAVLEWLSLKSEHGGAEAAECYRKSPSEFEKYVDNRLMATARKAKTVTLGSEVLMGYVLARLAEVRMIAMIASGIRTGIGEAAIRERLRELYE